LVALAHKIIEIVYREATDCCASPKVALDPLRDFLAGLFAAGRTRIYSTNYDDFVLQAVPGLYTGFSGPADPSRFDIDTFWNHAEENALFHLHGSTHLGFPTPAAGAEIGELFWYEGRADAALHSTFHGSSVSRMDGSSFMPTAVITGLDKLSRLQQRPLSYYYSALSRDAMTADALYVLGSGLADLHLNTWLKEARSKKKRTPLVYVDFMPNGLNNALSTGDAKMIRLFHSLEVHVAPTMAGHVVAPGWTITADGSAAIYDQGFQSSLRAPADFAKVKALLGI
jgi:hypothetical protein